MKLLYILPIGDSISLRVIWLVGFLSLAVVSGAVAQDPTVERTQATIELSDSCQPPSAALYICVSVQNMSNPTATLSYRSSASESFTDVTMDKVSSDFCGSIPGDSVACNDSVYYYVVAEDATDIVSTPASDPETNPYEIDICANTAPVCSDLYDIDTFQCTGAEISQQISPTDGDGNLWKCEMVSEHGWLTGSSGSYSWQYTPSGDASFTVEIMCTDSCGATCTKSFNVDVGVNEPPSVTVNSTEEFREDFDSTFQVIAGDPDGNLDSIVVNDLPAEATFEDHGDGTGTFSWKPSFTDSGSYYPEFCSHDACGEVVCSTVNVHVENTNQIPVLDHVDNMATKELQEVSQSITATDADGDYVWLWLDTTGTPILESSLTQTGDGIGEFKWHPRNGEKGTYWVTFWAFDYADSDYQEVKITVSDSNQAPEWSRGFVDKWSWRGGDFNPIGISVGTSQGLDKWAFDPDGDYPLYVFTHQWPSEVSIQPVSDTLDAGESRIFTIQATNPNSSFYVDGHFSCTDSGTPPRSSDPSLLIRMIRLDVDKDSIDFEIVLVEETSAPEVFTITNPGHTQVILDPFEHVDEIEIVPNGGTVPNNGSADFSVTWTPTESGQDPGNIVITAGGVPGEFTIGLTGSSMAMSFDPDHIEHDFGNVNMSDSRAFVEITSTFNIVKDASLSGSINSAIALAAADSVSEHFTVTEPDFPLSLDEITELALTVRAHPRDSVEVSAEVLVYYSVDIGEKTSSYVDSLMTLSATGVEAMCVVLEEANGETVPDTVDIGSVAVDSTESRPIWIRNNSSVTHVIDSIIAFPGSYTSSVSMYQVIPDSFQLYIPTGEVSELSIEFTPDNTLLYTDTLVIFDSVVETCDTTLLNGLGIIYNWQTYVIDKLDPVTLCDTSDSHTRTFTNISGHNATIDSLVPDSADWFVFVPPLSELSNVSVGPTNSEEFSYRFVPQDTGDDAEFGMTIFYALSDNPDSALEQSFDFVKARGCAGMLDTESLGTLDFGSVDVNDSNDATFTLRNSGECLLTINEMYITGDGFTLIDPVYPPEMQGNSEQQIGVRFSPDLLGASNAELTISHDGYVAPFDIESDCGTFRTYQFTLTGVGIDTTLPVVGPIVTGDSGSSVFVYATDAGSGIDSDSITAFWRRGDWNSVEGDAAELNSIDVGVWKVEPPDGALTPVDLRTYGWEAKVRILDVAGNPTTTPWIGVQGSFDADIWYIIDDSLLDWDTLWHLISIPGDLSSDRRDSVFSALSGDSSTGDKDKDRWRLYEYDDNGFFQLSRHSDTIAPGAAYWFKHIDPDFTLELPSGLTQETVDPFPIELEQGWNLIGNPFFFDVYLGGDQDSVTSFIKQKSGGESGSDSWASDSNYDFDQLPLQPWKGYAIHAEESNVTLYLYPHYTPDTPASPSPRNDWSMPIALIEAGEYQGKVRVGLCPYGSDGPDIRDCRPITFFGGSPKIVLRSEEHGEFISDIRRTPDLQTFNLEIAPEAVSDLTFAWEPRPLPEPGMSMILRDLVTGSVTNMTVESRYTVPSPGQLPPGRFVIYLGRIEHVAAASRNPASTKPIHYSMYQNYPNPFNPSTTIAFDTPMDGQVRIDIFNILGQRVVTIVDEFMHAGSYRFEWDGRDRAGNHVTSGIYFAKLSTQTHTSSIKLLLLK